MALSFKEFRKERKEHPSFTNKQVWKIVADHDRSKKRKR